MTFPCGWSNSKGPEGQQIVVWNHERDQQQILSFLRTYRTHNPAPAGDAFFAEFRIQNRDHRLTFHLKWLFYSIFFPLATCVCVCVCSGAHREINILQNNNDILCPVRNCSGGTDRNRTDGRRQYGCSRRHYNCYKWYFYPVLFFHASLFVPLRMVQLCNVNPCANGGTCWTTEESFYCACRPGFTGKMCEGKDFFCIVTSDHVA